jgi:hypothetical protein
LCHPYAARAQFVRLSDTSDPQRFGGSANGFDLDAIEAGQAVQGTV